MFKSLPSQKASIYQVLTARLFNPTDFEIVPRNHRHLGQGEAVALEEDRFLTSRFYGLESEYTFDKFLVSFASSPQNFMWRTATIGTRSSVHLLAIYRLSRELSVVDRWEKPNDADKLQAVPPYGHR